jgi:hypothetical protein
MEVRLSALRAGRILLPRNIFSLYGTHFCQRLSKPQGLVRLDGLGQLKKNPITSSELEPVTFQLVP